MRNLSKEDIEKYERNKELTKQLTEALSEYKKIHDNYYSGKASADELIKSQEKLSQIQQEWRSTLTLFNEK